MNISESEQELRHPYANGVLTDLAHVIEVELEHALQFELVLEVVDHTGCITDSSLLMDGTAYEVLVDVVLEPDRGDVVDIVQSLLNGGLTLGLGSLFFAHLTAFLFNEYLSEESSQPKHIIKIQGIVIDLVLQYDE